jgi:plasmid replication initiation protein
MKNAFDDFYDNPRNRSVRKANDLIQKSRFDLSLQQQKVILYLISKISPYDKDFQTYEFNIKEFCQVCGIDYQSGRNYEALKDQIKRIADKSIWIRIPEKKEQTLIRWIEKPRIKENSGIVEIKLDEDLKPYLLQLRQNFTQYELIYTLCFNSKYTIRLYELIKSIQYDELKPYEREYDLDEFKDLLGASSYKAYHHFKERVLDRAVTEINEHSDKNIEYALIKSGKKVIGIRLKISTKEIVERIKIRAEIEDLLPKQISISEYLEEQKN